MRLERLRCRSSVSFCSTSSIYSLAIEAHALGARALSFFPADLSRQTHEACARAGLEVMSGTPNDARTWEQMSRANARAIITDSPVECRDWLATFVGGDAYPPALEQAS